MEKALLETDIKEYPLFSRGKVRDVYDLGDKLLIVATDRVSAFDCVLPNGIPGKGRILPQCLYSGLIILKVLFRLI